MASMNAVQLTFDDLPVPAPTARELRDEGMERAIQHAEADVPGWKDRALDLVRRYAIANEQFICEDVRAFALAEGLPPPPDGRAWGSVMMRAAQANYVTKTDRVACAKDPKVHMSPSTVWLGVAR